MGIKRLIMATLILLVFSMSFGSAQKLNQAHETIFIYQLTNYVEWKNDDQSNFIIGIYGKSNIAFKIVDVGATRTVKEKKVVVKNFDSPDHIGYCHMLFIPASYKNIKEVISAVDAQKTLIITEKENALQQGAHINFVSVDGHLNFELNESLFKGSKMKISGQLKKLAVNSI